MAQKGSGSRDFLKLRREQINLNLLPKTVNNLFKFSAQDSDLEYLCWQWKNSPVPSDLKPPLTDISVMSSHFYFCS